MLWSCENTFPPQKITLFNNSSPLCQRSIILENICWTQAAYASLCQPHLTDTSSTFVYVLIWMKTAYPCGAADTEQPTQFASSGYSPKWRYADAEETNCWIKSFFGGVFCIQKVFSQLHNITVEPLMADGLFWQCFYTFLCLDSVNCLAVNGTVTSLLVFIQNILNCVPKTNKAFTGLERNWGKWLMTTFSFWGGVTL